MVVAAVVIVALLVGLPVAALVVAPRLREPQPHPATGTGQRADHLARRHDGDEATAPPPGVPPAELGALALPDARYQQATATLLDLAARGHLEIALATAPRSRDDTAWWTLTRTTGDDDLRDYEQTLLDELGGTDPVTFPSLTNHSVDRVARRLHQHHYPNTTAAAGAALQRGIARHPDLVDPKWFAHSVALDVSPPLTRSLTARHVPTPGWATTHCDHPVTWALLERLTLDGSPLLPQSPGQAGYTGSGL